MVASSPPARLLPGPLKASLTEDFQGHGHSQGRAEAGSRVDCLCWQERLQAVVSHSSRGAEDCAFFSAGTVSRSAGFPSSTACSSHFFRSHCSPEVPGWAGG